MYFCETLSILSILPLEFTVQNKLKWLYRFWEKINTINMDFDWFSITEMNFLLK